MVFRTPMAHENCSLLDIIEATAALARTAWEPVWPIWKRLNRYPGPEAPGSRDSCIPTSFALRIALARTVPEVRWRVVGGRPTKRNPASGVVDAKGTIRPHLWVEGRHGRTRIVVDITADQFGLKPVVVATGVTASHTASATARLLRFYEAHESDTITRFLAALNAVMLREQHKNQGQQPSQACLD